MAWRSGLTVFRYFIFTSNSDDTYPLDLSLVDHVSPEGLRCLPPLVSLLPSAPRLHAWCQTPHLDARRFRGAHFRAEGGQPQYPFSMDSSCVHALRLNPARRGNSEPVEGKRWERTHLQTAISGKRIT
jgi:hypothetical protein